MSWSVVHAAHVDWERGRCFTFLTVGTHAETSIESLMESGDRFFPLLGPQWQWHWSGKKARGILSLLQLSHTILCAWGLGEGGGTNEHGNVPVAERSAQPNCGVVEFRTEHRSKQGQFRV